jgi:hypothetical protein
MEIFGTGAVSSFAAAVGLLWFPTIVERSGQLGSAAEGAKSLPIIWSSIARSMGWQIAAAVSAAPFIGVLGRGISWKI